MAETLSQCDGDLTQTIQETIEILNQGFEHGDPDSRYLESPRYERVQISKIVITQNKVNLYPYTAIDAWSSVTGLTGRRGRESRGPGGVYRWQ